MTMRKVPFAFVFDAVFEAAFDKFLFVKDITFGFVQSTVKIAIKTSTYAINDSLEGSPLII